MGNEPRARRVAGAHPRCGADPIRLPRRLILPRRVADFLKVRAGSVVTLRTAMADRGTDGRLARPATRGPSDRLARDRGSGRGCGRVVTSGQPECPRNVASQPAPETSATAAGTLLLRGLSALFGGLSASLSARRF